MDQMVTLLVALFGGAAASLVAGYFARPKTKGEAAQANANATVSLSSDARAWAELWMKKAENAEVQAKAAEKEAHEAREKAEDAEDRVERAERRLSATLVYMETLRTELTRMGGTVPDPPEEIRHLMF